MFGWIAGYQRRGFAEEDEVSVHAAELMGRLYDLLDASGYGGHGLGVLLVRLVFIMFADDTSVVDLPRDGGRSTNGHRTATGAPPGGAPVAVQVLPWARRDETT